MAWVVGGMIPVTHTKMETRDPNRTRPPVDLVPYRGSKRRDFSELRGRQVISSSWKIQGASLRRDYPTRRFQRVWAGRDAKISRQVLSNDIGLPLNIIRYYDLHRLLFWYKHFQIKKFTVLYRTLKNKVTFNELVASKMYAVMHPKCGH